MIHSHQYLGACDCNLETFEPGYFLMPHQHFTYPVRGGRYSRELRCQARRVCVRRKIGDFRVLEQYRTRLQTHCLHVKLI